MKRLQNLFIFLASLILALPLMHLRQRKTIHAFGKTLFDRVSSRQVLFIDLHALLADDGVT